MSRFEQFSDANIDAMSGSELEQYAERGEGSRRHLSTEVVHQLHLPECWQCDIEYRSEFGFATPVCIQLTPVACPDVMIFLFSSSDDVPFWRMCLPFQGGECAAWIYSSEQFNAQVINTVLTSVYRFIHAGIVTPEQISAALRQTGGAV